jgi:4-hydroxy-L-threonine phosphate dehydrogenase PdxA
LGCSRIMKIGITLGDPAGIGPEIILKAGSKIAKYKNIFIFGNKNILKKTARDLRLLDYYKVIEKNIIDCVENIKFQYGVPTEKTGRAAIQSIESILEFYPDIIITPPIVKDVIRSAVPNFIGHTEYFAKFFGIKKFAMVAFSKERRIMLLTTHLPLRHIFRKITSLAVVQKIFLLDWGLKKYFACKKPKIGVCALNPHAFEFSLGEDDKIKKGILMARKKKIMAEGPFPADALFDRDYDGFLAMFHDQAMIYLKSKKDGLNFTLGLPIIRLSPLHGAALDIAGKNKANASGLITALRVGIKLFNNARKYEREKTK